MNSSFFKLNISLLQINLPNFPGKKFTSKQIRKMIRNKTPYLIAMKQQKRGANYRSKNNSPNLMSQQPHWFEEYYQEKELLHRIAENNKNISLLTNQYQTNPTVYALKQVERLITQNCLLIDEVDRWVSNFRYSPSSQHGILETEKSICKYFQIALSQQILALFNCKQIITSVNNQLDQHNSFSQLNHSGYSHSLSRSQIAGDPHDRNRVFQEVNYKIENLNIILRRMNTLVASQGDLVNRIDENLAAGEENLKSANVQLKRRVDRQEGVGEFSIQGKVNQAITGLYIINLVLILIFFIKNVFF